MRKILGAIRKLCSNDNLIENGDKIAVGVSGGKDSLVLLTALKKLQSFYDKKFEVIGISIDLSNGKMNFDEISSYCKKLDIPYYIKKSNVFEVIFDIRKEKNPCSLCANMRRGELNSYAKELGCNKVALGHHMDDLIETFLLSLFFEGRLSTLQTNSYLSRTNLNVIRPMLYVAEEDILKVSKDLPVVKNVCPADKHTKREEAKETLKTLEKIYPGAKEKIFNAIIHPERYNLWKKNED